MPRTAGATACHRTARVVTFGRGDDFLIRERLVRKELALLAAIAAVFTFVTFSANAMPAAPLKGAAASTQNVETVSGGCGRYWHRGPRGGCRHN